MNTIGSSEVLIGDENLYTSKQWSGEIWSSLFASIVYGTPMLKSFPQVWKLPLRRSNNQEGKIRKIHCLVPNSHFMHRRVSECIWSKLTALASLAHNGLRIYPNCSGSLQTRTSGACIVYLIVWHQIAVASQTHIPGWPGKGLNHVWELWPLYDSSCGTIMFLASTHRCRSVYR